MICSCRTIIDLNYRYSRISSKEITTYNYIPSRTDILITSYDNATNTNERSTIYGGTHIFSFGRNNMTLIIHIISWYYLNVDAHSNIFVRVIRMNSFNCEDE